MSSTITISCILNTTNPGADLGFEAWINDRKFVDIDHVQSEQAISIEIVAVFKCSEIRLYI